MIRKMFVIAGLIMISPALLAATFESSAQQVTLLELYSSEGCSSCPPADAWVRQFLEPSNLWQDYVPVVFHVDYWDRLGWKDPFASARYTQRQEDYARSWGSSNLFTPNVVINGKSWEKWHRLKTLPTFNQNAGVLKAEKKESGKWEISFSPSEKSNRKYEVHLALLGFEIQSVVSRGENSGKTLEHDFVVLDYRHQQLDGSVMLDLAEKDERAQKLGVAVWVSQLGNPTPIQATGGYLNE